MKEVGPSGSAKPEKYLEFEAEVTDGSDSEFSPAMIDDFTDGSGGSGSTSEQLKKAQSFAPLSKLRLRAKA